MSEAEDDDMAPVITAARKQGFQDGLEKGFVEGLKAAQNMVRAVLHDPLTYAEIHGVYGGTYGDDTPGQAAD